MNWKLYLKGSPLTGSLPASDDAYSLRPEEESEKGSEFSFPTASISFPNTGRRAVLGSDEASHGGGFVFDSASFGGEAAVGLEEFLPQFSR